MILRFFISRNIFEDTPMNENILDKAKASAAVIKHKVSDLKENFGMMRKRNH